MYETLQPQVQVMWLLKHSLKFRITIIHSI